MGLRELLKVEVEERDAVRHVRGVRDVRDGDDLVEVRRRERLEVQVGRDVGVGPHALEELDLEDTVNGLESWHASEHNFRGLPCRGFCGDPGRPRTWIRKASARL